MGEKEKGRMSERKIITAETIYLHERIKRSIPLQRWVAR